MPERRLDVLLAEMNPQLHDGGFAFCLSDEPVPDAIATFAEAEGTTVVLRAERAEELGLTPLYVADWITLNVHSDLDAVGFLAAVSTKLASAGISCNVFSAVYHDHLFVPYGRGTEALEILEG